MTDKWDIPNTSATFLHNAVKEHLECWLEIVWYCSYIHFCSNNEIYFPFGMVRSEKKWRLGFGRWKEGSSSEKGCGARIVWFLSFIFLGGICVEIFEWFGWGGHCGFKFGGFVLYDPQLRFRRDRTKIEPPDTKTNNSMIFRLYWDEIEKRIYWSKEQIEYSICGLNLEILRDDSMKKAI